VCKIAVLALPDTAAFFRAIVDSSDDAIVSKDLNGMIQTWNRAAERLFGYTADEAVGKHITLIIPDDRRSEEDLVIGGIRMGQTVEHFETIRRRKDGTLVPISLTVSPIRDDQGRVIGASKIARDISERRRFEAIADRAASRDAFLAGLSTALTRSLDYKQSLRTLATFAVPRIADWCAVDIVDDEGEVVRLAVAHVDPAKAELALRIRDRYEDPESPNSPIRIIRTGTPALIPDITDEMIVASARGDTERIELVRSLGVASYLCVPMIAHDRTLGAITFAIGASGRRFTNDDLRFAEDVASRAALAVENAQAFEQLEVANRLKDEFLATLSHELRTPLNAILGYARMLRSGAITTERTSQAMDVIERNATSLAQIVEDVLDVSRIISGKTRLQVQAVTLADVVRDAVATLTPAADAKGVRLHAILDSHVGSVSGDPDRLQQVVWNLLSNAVKFTPRGGRVQVALQPVNSHVEIVVSDTGIGIPRDFLPFIFERFRQADSTTTRRHGGLGLGLAIARHIVELHGGTIQATSEGEGKGATFRVRLPLMIARAERAGVDRVHPRHERRGDPARVMPTLNGVHVLAVDDDEDALALLRDILQTAGARVTTVASAAAALERLEADRPNVLVADLGLPVMDGFDLINRVRASRDPRLRHIPATALTAYARSEDRARALRSGFEMHLAKPIDPAELVAAVAALARRHH